MNLALGSPWALLSLFALPLLYWLHRHVIEARRIDVSYLWLWADSAPTAHEGLERRRVPWPLVLGLELAAALALCLLAAGLELHAPPSALRPQLIAVIDTSASMGGAAPGLPSPLQRAHGVLDRLAREHPGLVLTLVTASEQPQLLGERQQPAQSALARLSRLTPRAGECRMDAALELAAALGARATNLLVFSDDPQLSHPRLVPVGMPAGNTGFVHATWRPGAHPFVVIHHFARARAKVTLQIDVDQGRSRSQQIITLEPDAEQAFELPLDAQTERVDLALPDDALALDNRLTLLRPHERRVSVRSQGLSPALAQAVQRAIAATPTLRASSDPNAALVISENPSAPATGPMLAFLTHPRGVGRPALALQVDPFARVLQGFDARDLVWSSWDSAPAAGARVLLQAQDRALIWQDGAQLFVNIKLERSNLLSHSGFPILLANLGESIDAALGGLPDRNFVQSSRLTFAPPRGSTEAVTVQTPSGKALRFEPGAPIELGVLSETGIHTLRAGTQRELFAVALLSVHESDLLSRAREDATALPPLRLTEPQAADAHTSLRVPLLLIALACVALAYALLARAQPGRRAAA